MLHVSSVPSELGMDFDMRSSEDSLSPFVGVNRSREAYHWFSFLEVEDVVPATGHLEFKVGIVGLRKGKCWVNSTVRPAIICSIIILKISRLEAL